MTPVRIVILVIGLIGFAIASAQLACSRKKIVGGWVAELSTSDSVALTFRKDNTFSIEFRNSEETEFSLRMDGTYRLNGEYVRVEYERVYTTAREPAEAVYLRQMVEQEVLDKEGRYADIQWEGDTLVLKQRDVRYRFTRSQLELPAEPSKEQLASLTLNPDDYKVSNPNVTRDVPWWPEVLEQDRQQQTSPPQESAAPQEQEYAPAEEQPLEETQPQEEQAPAEEPIEGGAPQEEQSEQGEVGSEGG